MEATKTFSQMVDFQQVMFNNTFNMMKTFQTQGEAWMNLSMDQNPWLPEDGKKVCNYWNETCQNSLDNYKEFMDTSFTKAKEIFGPPAAKPAKK